MAGVSDFHGIFFCNGSVKIKNKQTTSVYDKEKYFVCFEVHSPECITASYLNLKVKSITMEISLLHGVGNNTVTKHELQRNPHFHNCEAGTFFSSEIDLKSNDNNFISITD